MFTLCILFTTLATNTYGMFEGASKQILNLKILPRRDRAPPPRFEIPRSATVYGPRIFISKWKYDIFEFSLVRVSSVV